MLSLRTNVQALPAVFYVTGDNLMIRSGLKFTSDYGIDREHHLAADIFGLFQETVGLVNKVVFTETVADLSAQGLKKRIGHRTTDQNPVHFAEQVFNDLDLVRNLRAAENGWCG